MISSNLVGNGLKAVAMATWLAADVITSLVNWNFY